ncbi:hypothetical protein [Spirosoma validum]|uniref:Uncharacterized protein n=1 Tax=Spirosoma validum TaxID=2771355 RepID=A0A927B5P0_9BACT|nr:hypothetical protein [Spirosoma validum]MBD2755763.1 hypothetical protein [Spirosoma validum]
MKAGLIYNSRRPSVYYKLKRQVVLAFAAELKQAPGWKRNWVRWKRSLALDIRYNQLLFSRNEKSVTFTINSLIQR